MKRKPLKSKMKLYKMNPAYKITVYSSVELDCVYILEFDDSDYFAFNSLVELQNFIALNYET